jgi:hypothetical protein
MEMLGYSPYRLLSGDGPVDNAEVKHLRKVTDIARDLSETVEQR